ncbi:hypothetical protein AVEN_140952-1 [Araneus ventricosus]|uniref:Uncharacterized protein n=1 Tax=Araneus ventricosus TaxID=182803 RepID=A0A4Y2GBV0_ARAVE|nr:hypothetical protein AVEN_140952-1 [Araneus ventricosus]
MKVEGQVTSTTQSNQKQRKQRNCILPFIPNKYSWLWKAFPTVASSHTSLLVCFAGKYGSRWVGGSGDDGSPPPRGVPWTTSGHVEARRQRGYQSNAES